MSHSIEVNGVDNCLKSKPRTSLDSSHIYEICPTTWASKSSPQNSGSLRSSFHPSIEVFNLNVNSYFFDC